MLRDYQQKTIDLLYEWFYDGNKGNPCLVLPTGAGKSHIVAALCKDALKKWPDTRVLMLTHVKELIQQNAEKMLQHWPNAPMGIYSASVGKRQMGNPITFGGIQSLRGKAARIGHIDIIIIDECHLVSHKSDGMYRQLIADLMAINPRLRVVGLTATPWRLGHGRIDEGEALFDDLIEPITIDELVSLGHLAPLHSKVTNEKLSIEGVHKRGGDFIESELQQAVDKADLNLAIVKEIVKQAGDRKSWLVFCTGVDHSHHIRDCLRDEGVIAETITGGTPKKEREEIIKGFKSGRIKALTNANVLTTGFDAPDTDLIAFLRPTISPVLYMQMAGRGLRIKNHTDHCLVLDFAGVVQTHGPITCVREPKAKGDGGEAPVKVCETCFELVHPSIRICPRCGTPFPEPEPKKVATLHADDIMGAEVYSMEVSSWFWTKHTSRNTGKEMMRVTYYGDYSYDPINEYLTVLHQGFAGHKAVKILKDIGEMCGIPNILDAETLDAAVDAMNSGEPPKTLEYKMEGKWPRVINRIWGEIEQPEYYEEFEL